MELSKTIGSMAVVLGIAVAGGFAVGEDGQGPPKQIAQPSMPKRADESQRRMTEQERVQDAQRRKEAFERACHKPLKSDIDFDLCRAAYKRLAGS
jgi:hypothetical protein